MNEKDKPSTGGQQPTNKRTFGQMKNQGRNSYSENSPGNIGRSRSNAINDGPGSQSRSNATYEAPSTRSRSNALFGAPEVFRQVKNEGRGSANDKPDRPANNSSSSPAAKQNLGRNSYQSSNDNRNDLSPSQKVGFNLVAGFMDKLIKEADRSNAQQDDPGAKRSQQGAGHQFGQQDQEDQEDQEDKRRRSIQSSQRDDDEGISAGDFFKRLNSTIADPQKFKNETAQRTQAREQRNNNKSDTLQNNRQQNSSQHDIPQQRQQSSSQQRQQLSEENEQIRGKEFFQRLQGAMKDPAEFKRRVEAQKRTDDKTTTGPSNPSGQLESNTHQQRGNKHPGGNQPGERPNQPSKTMPSPAPGNKTGSQGIKRSPRK